MLGFISYIKMKVFMSVFKHEKCTSCNRAFQITWKRRLCRECSKCYVEQLFCTDCSIKVKAPEKGLFRHKRYCLTCHALIENNKKAQVEKAKLIEREYQEKLFKSNISPINNALAEENTEDLKQEEQKCVQPPKKAFLQGIQRKLSRVLVFSK